MKKETGSLEKELSLCENPVYGVAEGLTEEGYVPAGRLSVRSKKLDPNMVGILKDRDPVQESFLGFTYNKKQRGFDLGTIWINNKEKGAIADERWVLEVNGKEYLSKLKKIVKKLSAPYNVKVHVELVNDTPKEETYLSELYND